MHTLLIISSGSTHPTLYMMEIALRRLLLLIMVSLSCIVGQQQQQTVLDIATVKYDGIVQKGQEIVKKEWKVEKPDASIMFTKEGK